MKELPPVKFALLPSSFFMMAAIAGFVDVIGFVGVDKLFTAHITGNIVVAISNLIHHEPGVASKLIALPLFIVIAALVTGFIEAYGQAKKFLSMWLFFEAVFLASFMFAAILIFPQTAVNSLSYISSAMLAICSMAIHNTLLRTYMTRSPPCTVMTGNLTQLIVDIVSCTRGWRKAYSVESRSKARQGVKRHGNVFIGFLVGGVVAAVGYTLFSFWVLWIPILLLIFMAFKANAE